MTWAKRYALRNVAFSISKDAAFYGGAINYGDSTYGQETSDPLANVDYVLVAKPGDYPSSIGWIYRVGDTDVAFQAQVLGLGGPMDLTNVSQAALVITRESVGPVAVHAVEATTGTTDGLITATLPATMLADQGIYRVALQLVFSTGRAMTITPDEQASLAVQGVN